MGKSVLLIDDDLYIRDLYKDILKNAGYEVDIAEDGKIGLDKMSQGGYDLVLLDVMMPKLDGIGILTELKRNPPKEPNKAIVMLTNLVYDPVVKEAFQKGVVACFNKVDLNPKEFLRKIEKILKG